MADDFSISTFDGFIFFFWYTPNPINPGDGWVLSEWIKAPVISSPAETRFPFMVNDTGASDVIYSETYTEAAHHAHYPAMIISLLVAGFGILFAFYMYQWKKINPDKIASSVPFLYRMSFNKWYFDELYDKTFVNGTLVFSRFLSWFDNTIIDGIVNGTATVTKAFSVFTGKFDTYVVDGTVNSMALLSGFVGGIFRKFQTGKVQTYIVLVIFSIVIFLFFFK
jgi:NADH-quinone oxidoreductase subunit L